MNRMLNQVWSSFKIVSGLMLHWFLKVIYRENLNKNDAVMEKEEELIE